MSELDLLKIRHYHKLRWRIAYFFNEYKPYLRNKYMPPQDIRWIQRFEHYNKALGQLRKFIEHGELNEFEEQGLIQAFEYTYELDLSAVKSSHKSFESRGFQISTPCTLKRCCPL